MSGARLGILGGGQLGRMLALAAARLGVRTRCLESTKACPAGDVCEVIADRLDDPQHLDEFLDGLEAVTLEFENVPAALLERIERRGVAVRPGALALRTSQDRALEKALFARLGIPTPTNRCADSLDELRAVVKDLGLPVVIKTRRFGYDGKGQAVVRREDEVAGAWAALQRGVPDSGSSNLGPVPLIVERMVAFEREVSVLAVAGVGGLGGAQVRVYPVTENRHEGGILRVSRAPADEDRAVQEQGEAIARAIVRELRYVGVLAVELFDLGLGAAGGARGGGGRLWTNEIAPRVHNSGHWTMNGAVTCQFENHVRAVMGWPLGDTGMVVPHAGMANLIGQSPPTGRLLETTGAHVHLYNKSPRPGRKLGHVNVIGATAAERDARLKAVQSLVNARDGVPSK